MSDSGIRLAVQQALESRLTFLEQDGKDFNYTCPFCAKNGEQHTLHINYEKGDAGAAICHTCHYKTRDLLRLIRDLFGAVPRRFDVMVRSAEFMRSIEEILAETDDDGKQDDPVPLPESFKRLPYKGRGIAHFIRRYLEKRGVTYDDIDTYGIGYLDDENHPAFGYAIFPFWMRGRCVYWQGRRALGQGPKSYNPPSTGRKSFLFGYDQAVTKGTLFVAEGPLDAIAWGRGGLGLMGTVIQPQQIRAIALLEPRRTVVCLDGPKPDGSEDAYTETRQIARDLRRALPGKVGYLLLKRGDPNSNRDRLRRLYRRDTVWLKGKSDDIVERVKELLE